MTHRKCHKCHHHHKCKDEKVRGNLKVCKNLTVKKDLIVDGDITFGGCLNPIGKLVLPPVSLETPCVEVPCDQDINITDINLDKELIQIDLLEEPLNLPEVPVSMEDCPESGTEGTIPVGDTLSVEYLDFVNASVIREPGNLLGPIFVHEDIDPTSSHTGNVMVMSCAEQFTSLLGTESVPSGNRTNTRVGLSFSGVTTSLVQLTINYGFSSEPTYDFFQISVGGEFIVNDSGYGPDASSPFVRGSVTLVVEKDDVITINYFKDALGYSGLDQCYFYITDVTQVNVPAFPTSLILERGGEIIEDYGSIFNLDDPELVTANLLCPISLKAGDQLCLNSDPEAYSKFEAQVDFFNLPNIVCHYEVQEHKAKVIMNEIQYNNRQPIDESNIAGWYESDTFIFGTILVEPLKDGLKVTAKDVQSSGPFFLNAYWGGQASQTWPKVGPNLYQNPFGAVYKFNENGDLLLNYKGDGGDPSQVNLLGVSPLKYRPVGQPDDKFWDYNFALKDYSHIFNSPIEFFKFVYEYYSCGFLAQFTDESLPQDEDLNPMDLDMSNMLRDYGGFTREEYDSLFKELFYNGILRKYDVNRAIYWPYPGSAASREELEWVVNINNYGLIGIVPTQDVETGRFYPKLCPGEDVILKGTGVSRLDDTPLRLVTNGYHNGPQPGPDFTQTAPYFDTVDQWSLQTVRLPMIIDETNCKIGYSDCVAEVTTDQSLPGEPFIGNPAYFGTTPIFSGEIVLADPLNASSPLDPLEVSGKVVLCIRGGASFVTKALNAMAGNAKALIVYNSNPGPLTPFGSPNSGVTIPVIAILKDDGVELKTAIESGTVNVDVDLTGDEQELVLPKGTFYFNEILDYIYNASNSGDVPFFLDVGNFDVTPIFGTELAVNNQLAIFSTGLFFFTNACINGPDHATNPSNFFGLAGMDIGYMFDQNIMANPFRLVELTGGESQYPGYKSHTPLTDDELDALITNIEAGNVTVEAQHGPITNDISYSELFACINELSMARQTEIHIAQAAWVQKAEQGLYEFLPDFDVLVDKLNSIVDDVAGLENYNMPSTQNSEWANQFAPTLYVQSIRPINGHPGEYSEFYTAGAARHLQTIWARSIARLPWNVPRNKMYYIQEPTLVPHLDPNPAFQNVYAREVEIPLVNYLDQPKWIIATKYSDPDTYVSYAAGPDAPAYGFVPFTRGYSQFGSTLDGQALPDQDPRIIAGHWLVGTVLQDRVAELVPPELAGEKIGYITHYQTEWGQAPDTDVTQLPWDALFPTVSPISFRYNSVGLAGAATVLKYFNDLGVKHIIVDQRNTIGGGAPFWPAMSCLVGTDRTLATDTVFPLKPVIPNSVQEFRNAQNQIQYAMDEGIYDGTIDVRRCIVDIMEGFVPESMWNGEVTGKQANFLWMTNQTTISATQLDYSTFKGTSLDKETFDGYLGKDTQFIGYGVYPKPFSTGGGYTSYLNWWTRGRNGTESAKVGLCPGIDRWEGRRLGYVQGPTNEVNQPLPGSEVKGFGQEFGNFQRPNIKWDMNGTVAFQDIGFTKDNVTVDPALDGEPFAPKRYEINFCDPLTFRDTLLERAVQIVTDPDINDHLWPNDGTYGYVDYRAP